MTRTELDNLKRIVSQAGFSKWSYVTADSEFYHAFCPPTALALIDRIEALEAVAEAARAAAADHDLRHEDWNDKLSLLETLLSALDKGEAR